MIGTGVRYMGPSCVAMAVLMAGSASAAIQTRTVSNGGPGLAAIALFDPALGRLLSVYAEASYTSWIPYRTYGPTFGYDHAVSGTAIVGGLSFAIDGRSQVTQWDGTSGLFTVTANGAATWANPVDLALFAGSSGSVLGYAGASAAAPGTTIAGNFVPSVNYKVTYTFDNSPAVPEPATWAMMGGGFVLMGLALRAARRSRAEAKAIKA